MTLYDFSERAVAYSEDETNSLFKVCSRYLFKVRWFTDSEETG